MTVKKGGKDNDELTALVKREFDRRMPNFMDECLEGQKKAWYLRDTALETVADLDESMGGVKDSIKDINARMAYTVTKEVVIEEVEKSSDRLGKKIDTLADLAEKTNSSVLKMDSNFDKISTILSDRYERLDKDLENLSKKIDEKLPDLSNRVAVLETNQDSILSVAGKLSPYLLIAVVAGYTYIKG